MSVSFLRSWIYGSSTETSTNNSGSTSLITTGSVTLSVSDTTKDDDNNDDTPPVFPSPNSIQRSGPSMTFSVSRSSNGLSKPNRGVGLMPPPASLPSRPDVNKGNSIPDIQVQSTDSSNIIPDRMPAYDPRFVNGLRTISSSSSSSASGNFLQLPPSTVKVPTLTPKQRQKVALAPGHSTLDWAALKKSGKNLRGVPTLLRVTPSMLKMHKQPGDAWTSINGKIYNITPYLDFHPGGVKELMRVAGRDGTKLFALTHSWVNVELMLDECLVGFLVPEPSSAT